MTKDTVKKYDQNGNELAIRFGLGGIKAVGISIMEEMTNNRKSSGDFKDVYDFAARLGIKIINKKSVEALSKAGAFDNIHKNRRQIFESCEIIGKYASVKEEERNSNQMSLFNSSSNIIIEEPALEKVEDWNKSEKLQKEFEAFGFFANEHPLDDFLDDLGKRGVTSSEQLDDDKIGDNNIIKLAGVVAYSKHRSGPRGRYAYLYLSDPTNIFETAIFNEELITNSRDLMESGSSLVVECLIRKDEGGTRLLVKDIQKLEDFIKNNKAHKEIYQDIKKQTEKKRNFDWKNKKQQENGLSNPDPVIYQALHQQKIDKLKEKEAIKEITIEIEKREAIFAVKALLSQKLKPEEIIEKNSKVFLSVKNDNKSLKIELIDNYLLDKLDIDKISSIAGVYKVIY